MNRMTVAIPAGLVAGALVGLMIGGLWLQWQIGASMNAGHPFVLITDFPGFRDAWLNPWRSAYLIVLVGAVAFAVLALVFSITHRLTTYGHSHFQTRREIGRNGLLKPAGHGLVFGKLGKPANRRGRFVSGSYDRFPHALVVAPTRAGKGVSYVIPNMLLFPGSCVVMDVKGEIFEATSRYRQSQGDAVFRFAPFDFEHPSHRYNPLERIAGIADTDQRFTELSKLASYFLVPKTEKGGASDFIVGARQLFVAGGMLAIERGTPSIGAISRILFGGGDKQKAYRGLAAELRHEPAATILLNFSSYSDRTLSSYASVLDGAGLGLWLNPRIDRVTNANDFSWDAIRRAPQSIYLVANSDDIETLAPLLRLMFGELIATMRARIPDPALEPWPVQIVLDEFDQLGHMPIVVQSLKQLAGHNVRVSIITQSIPGLDRIYEENDRLSIESACGMKLFIAPNEKKTASEVSEALGKTTRLSLSDSYSQNGDGLLKRSISRRNEERPLLTPDEVRKLDPGKMILIPERQHPILVDRIVYWLDPFFEAIMASQKGPLPWPPSRRDDMDAMEAVVESRLRQATLREGRVAYPPSDAAPTDRKGRKAKQKPLARAVAEEEHRDRQEAARSTAEAAGSEVEGSPAEPAATAEAAPPIRSTLARQVAQDVHGGNDRRSDADILAAIKPDTAAGKARMAGFTERVKAKGKAA